MALRPKWCKLGGRQHLLEEKLMEQRRGVLASGLSVTPALAVDASGIYWDNGDSNAGFVIAPAVIRGARPSRAVPRSLMAAMQNAGFIALDSQCVLDGRVAARPSAALTTAQLSPFALPDTATPTFTQQLLRAAAGLPQAAAVQATATGTTSMPRAEIGLFKALAKANSRSTYTEFVTVSGQTPVYGVNHKVPGDVDDSGCSDIADFRVTKQRDVWLKRAVPPLAIAIKADLNRDG